MQTDTSEILERPEPVHDFIESDPPSVASTELRVLEDAVENTHALPTNRGISVLCPGCSSEVKRYDDGIPTHLWRFKESCEDCGVDDLRRWSVICVAAEHADAISTDQLAVVTQAYWERHYWRGIQTSDRHPRKDEFISEYNGQADKLDWDWSLHCPLCRRAYNELNNGGPDFHHWCRPRFETDGGAEDPVVQDEHGVVLCRNCHDAISGGNTDSRQDWRARKLGLYGKHCLQLPRLAIRDLEADCPSQADSQIEHLQERFNLPYRIDEIQRIISQALSNEDIHSVIHDDALMRGLKD